MGKRQRKPEPFSVAELEEIAQSPALQGFEKVLQYRPVLMAPPATTVVDDPQSTVDDAPATTVVDSRPSTIDAETATTVVGPLASTVAPSPTATNQVLWMAEGGGGVFTSSRVKRIERAQDALTHVEEAVYDALWGTKREPEPFRLVQIGYAELAKRSRVSKRGIQRVTDRLLEKRFIQVETQANIYTRQSTIYRVFSYGTVLRFLRDTNRLHVVRTGTGVFYAHRIPVTTVDDSLATTVDVHSPSTVAASSVSTVEPSAPSTVAASSTVNTLGNQEGITSSSVSMVASRIVPLISVDDDAVRRLIENCRHFDPMASDEEIAYCAQLWIQQNTRNTSIRKPAAVMLMAVPKFFEAPATELTRHRTERNLQLQQSRELAQRILDDPESSDNDRQWARVALQTT
jgi:hypothetical protein